MIYYTTNCLSRNGCIAIYSFESSCTYTFGDKNGSCSPFVCPKSKGLALSDKLSNCAPRVRPKMVPRMARTSVSYKPVPVEDFCQTNCRNRIALALQNLTHKKARAQWEDDRNEEEYATEAFPAEKGGFLMPRG